MPIDVRSWPVAGAARAALIICLVAGSPARSAEDPPPTEADRQTQEPAGDAAVSQEESDEQAAIQRFMKEQAAEQQTLAGLRSTAAFREVRSITAPAGSGQVLAFHPLTDGGVVIATGAGERYGEQTTLTGAVASLLGFGGAKPSKETPVNQLIWLDAEGTVLRTAPLPFAAKGVTVAPDGGLVAVGADRVVAFAADGEQIAEAEAPHFRLSAEEQASLAEEIAEQHRERFESMREQMKGMVEAKAALKAIPEEERTPRQKLELARADITVKAGESMLANQVSAEEAVKLGLADGRSIHRVAASRDHLFLVAREPAGYGYGVWRCGRDFSSPEKVVGGLRGCCGQMDVQVIGDELVIAENARHQVVVLGLDGEPRRTFGQANRTDIRGGFGGCCNPMNSCCGPDGSLLLAESNGLVKQFAPDGTLIDIVGVANVQAGCKNSSIGFSTDGSTLYYLDIQNGRVLVLEKKS